MLPLMTFRYQHNVIIKSLIHFPPRKNSEALALIQVGIIDLQDPTQAQTVGIHHAMPYLGPKGPSGPGLIYLKQPLHFQPLVLPICLEESLEREKNTQLYDCWLPSWSLMRGE